MPNRTSRVAIASLCLAAAIGVESSPAGVRGPGSPSAPDHGIPLVATFVSGCQQFPPRVRSIYTAEGRPAPRPRGAIVDVFFAGSPPQRSFAVVGTVEVRARSRNSNIDNLLVYAEREARRLGGDALIEVRPRENFPADRERGARRLVITAEVARWQ
jgi:hypothetical protein